MQRDEVWAQGSQPGDPPISSVTVLPDPVVAARSQARERLRIIGRGPRPATAIGAQIHDLIIALHLNE